MHDSVFGLAFDGYYHMGPIQECLPVCAAGQLHDLRPPRVHGQQLQDVARVLDAPCFHKEQRVEHLVSR
jgi:hypothetical protein